MHEACKSRDVAQVREILARGLSVNAANEHGHTALHAVCNTDFLHAARGGEEGNLSEPQRGYHNAAAVGGPAMLIVRRLLILRTISSKTFLLTKYIFAIELQMFYKLFCWYRSGGKG